MAQAVENAHGSEQKSRRKAGFNVRISRGKRSCRRALEALYATFHEEKGYAHLRPPLANRERRELER